MDAYAARVEATGSSGDAVANNIRFTITSTHLVGSAFSAYVKSANGAAEAQHNYLEIHDSDIGLTVVSQIEAYQGTLLGSDNHFLVVDTNFQEGYASRFNLKTANTSYDSIQGSDNSFKFRQTTPAASAAGGSIVASAIATAASNIEIKQATMSNNTVTLETAPVGSFVFASGVIASETGIKIGTITSNDNTVTGTNVYAENVYAANFSNLVGSQDSPIQISSVEMKNNKVELTDSMLWNGVGAALVQENSNLSYDNITNNTVRIHNVSAYDGVYGAAYLSADRSTFHDINKGNSIYASGLNQVGTIGGFDKLTLKLAEENKSQTADAESGKAVINITGSNKTINFDKREIIVEAEDGITLANNEVLNLITVSGTGSSVVLPEGFKISKGDTFKVTDYKILGDDMTFNTKETLAITVTDATVPVDPEPTPPTDEEEGGEENNPDDGNSGDNADDGNNQGSWEVTTKPTDNAKTLAENYLGSAALIGLGTEYIADEGLAMIVDSAKLPGKNVFGAVYGGTGKYHTGSRLDLDSATLITGISAMTEKQTMAISAFVEAGWGDSEGHVNQAHAKADHNAYSMGTAMRFFTDSPWYFDASARLGVARFDYTGNFATESVKFDHSGIYAALHGAVGYAYPITEDTTLDSYLRYSFTYLEGGSEKLHNRAQDTFKMDSIRASAFRVGTRVKGYIGENQWLNYRLGAAYEKVVDGDANTKISGMSIDAPSLNGDTGIFEIGLAKRPTVQSPWGVDVTVKGYAGDRDGVYGSATLNYVF